MTFYSESESWHCFLEMQFTHYSTSSKILTAAIYFILFVMAACIAVAYICVVLFEMPIVQMEKLLFASFRVGNLPAVRRDVQIEEKKK